MSDKETDSEAPAPAPQPGSTSVEPEPISATKSELTSPKKSEPTSATKSELTSPKKSEPTSTTKSELTSPKKSEPTTEPDNATESAPTPDNTAEQPAETVPAAEEPQITPTEEPCDKTDENQSQSEPPPQDIPTEEPSEPVPESIEENTENITKTPERRESNAEDAPKPTDDQPDTVAVPPEPSTAERKESNVSEKDPKESATTDEKPTTDENDVNDDLQNMIKELTDPAPVTEEKVARGKETTENLISVLEDGIEAQTKEISVPVPAKEPAPVATTSSDPPKPPKPKKYLYKLKSKTGKILHYTSTVPITLKRPVIHLTKMQDTSVQKVIDLDKDDVDSDNSTNLKENEAPNDNVMRVIKKKGRPPLSSKTPPVITLDGNNSDTPDDPKNKSSFSMQTRKRQMKFLPDGRLITPEKRIKSDEKKGTSSSDSDIDIISSDSELTDSSAKKLIKKPEPLTKKYKPETVKINNSLGERRKYKKVFDFESYYREKTGVTPPANVIRAQNARNFGTTLTPIRKMVDTPRPKAIAPNNSLGSKKTSSVDPAQLLSSLIGVPINAGQLNVVKFKPKIIQERTNNIITSTPKKVTFEDEKTNTYTSSNQSELLKSTPFKIVSKPTYQKILPKPVGMDKHHTPIHNRSAFQPVNSSPSTSFVASTPPYLRESLTDTLKKFETFTDSKVVKTKEGPKKAVKRKHTGDDGSLKEGNSQTMLDLMYEIFEKMPSWNLHMVPDMSGFCVAKVSRGHWGTPTLTKTIEFNSEFSAKVYIHQLYSNAFDGVYDTKAKIIKLIKDVDAYAL